MKKFFKFLTKIKGFWKLYRDYEYDGEDMQFIIENYTKVICNRTRLMSKPNYYASDVIAQIDEWFEEMGYVYIERQDKPKYNYDKFKTALSTEELVDVLRDMDINCAESSKEYIEKYLEKKVGE